MIEFFVDVYMYHDFVEDRSKRLCILRARCGRLPSSFTWNKLRNMRPQLSQSSGSRVTEFCYASFMNIRAYTF